MLLFAPDALFAVRLISCIILFYSRGVLVGASAALMLMLLIPLMLLSPVAMPWLSLCEGPFVGVRLLGTTLLILLLTGNKFLGLFDAFLFL